MQKHSRAVSTIKAQNLELDIVHPSSRNEKSDVYHTITHKAGAKKIDLTSPKGPRLPKI